ncbi:MAG TPA: DUF262 domain-containing protein [Coriobacteriia bacterium]
MSESYRTSFFALGDCCESGNCLAVERVEIPLFQRDYAQGRQSDPVVRIRTDFLDALRAAVAGGETEAVGLDFVYGGVDDGTLRPLDGQQRLTTLFLLHWYLASRSGHLPENHNWKQFSYATRQSARMFCESLVEHPLRDGVVPSEWIKDQPWYLFLWRHDPTIQSMLVVLDAIDERFRDIDAATAWARLTDVESPAIWFLLLPLAGLGAEAGEDMRPEDLYIKMNSRGKPLTEFENFKAHFEKTIEWSPRSADFALNVDTRWSDLLWHLRGDDGVIDDEFLRYLEFVTEVCEWRDGRTDGAGQRLGPRTQAVFGAENPEREAHLDFLFQALDVWVENSESEVFEGLFGDNGATHADATKVPLFFRKGSDSEESLNLFEACCSSYGETRGRTRSFSLGQSLVLYAVLLHLIESTPDFSRRIRILRNIIEASADELRPERMPKILDDVHRIIRDGAVEEVASLNQAQAADERLKAAFIAANPDLQHAVFALEDHALLRGSLGAFELDAVAFEERAVAFESFMSQPELWSHLVAGLLAVGEYQRQRTNSRPFLFGTDSSRHDGAWRELLTGPRREALQETRQVLAAFLDRVAAAPVPMGDAMETIASEYLARCDTEKRFDWRYYMVKYPSMREDGASTYYAEPTDDAEQAAMGYSLCMLRAGRSALNSYYRDPYLLAIWRQLDDSGVVEDKWFSGYESAPRRLPLTRSGATIRCVPVGFELTPPPVAGAELFAAVCAEIGADADGLVMLPQLEVDGRWVDTVDRIQVGADIVRRLVAAGL